MDRVIVAVVIVAGFLALGFAGPDGATAEQAEPAGQVAPTGAVTADTAERLALVGSR